MENKNSKKIILLVDAYSSGNGIASEFTERGYRCAHIQSRSDLPLSFLNSYKSDDFFIHMQYEGAGTVEQLHKFEIVAVIAGCETGIELADSLAEALNLPGNKAESSRIRRNKYLMQESLRSNNLNYIPSYRITSAAEAVQYATKLFNQYRKLVLKPVDSAGTDSVYICNEVEEVIAHATRLLEKNNQLNLKNEIVLLQPFIEGDEYVVDTVSYDGCHKICAIWKMSKGCYNGADSICEFTELTLFDEMEHHRLKEYVFGCLDSMGIRYGAAHSELFLTPNGWTLIETGARLHGAGFPALSAFALERTQVDELVLSICSTESFLEKTSEQYTLQNCLRIKELISYCSGTVKSTKFNDTISNLPSYKTSKMPYIDQDIKVTTDVYSSPGWIALNHSSVDQIEADYQRIIDLEKTGMFEVHI